MEKYNAFLNMPQILGVFLHILVKLLSIDRTLRLKKWWIQKAVEIGFCSVMTNIFMSLPALTVKDYHVNYDPIIDNDHPGIIFSIFTINAILSVISGNFLYDLI